ncbi:MAG: hypothetical protein CXT73_04920 [Methanobacteriota archaeon]|nr:MAG: hypothetical protein CXT73_04920 [Euryarchaeota archaeon]
MKVPGIFNNKILCYAMLFLATMNIIGYLTTGAYECLLVFSVAYAGVNYLCKNQSCSILGALFAANFIWGCGRVKETFVETMKDSDAHMNDAADSSTKGALEAMKEFNKDPSDAKANKATVAAKAAEHSCDAACKKEEDKCKAEKKNFVFDKKTGKHSCE